MAPHRSLTVSSQAVTGGSLRAAAVTGGLAVVLAAWVVIRGEVPGELWLLTRVRGAGGEPAERVMLAISGATDLIPLGVVALGFLVVLLVRRRTGDAAYFAAAVAVVWAVNPVLKEIVARPRPDLWPLPEAVSAYSFPSGHAANTAALIGATLLVLRGARARVVGAIAGAGVLVLVALSQLVLGLHFPSDLVAGWLVAAAWINVIAALRDRSRT